VSNWRFIRNLVFIGENPANKSNRSSKGYVVRRIGPAVLVEWGSVAFLNRGPVATPRWRGKPRYKLQVCSSVIAAVRRVNAILKSQRDQGYKNAGGSILPPKGYA
jgi:hypothetical protein